MLIWPDCGRGVGLGHVTRCLAIAGAVERLGRVKPRFLLPEDFELARDAIEARGFECSEASFDAIEEGQTLLLDSYRVDPSGWRAARGASRRLAAIVDGPVDLPVTPDLALYYSVGAAPFRLGPGEPRWLLGPGYYPLRPAFRLAPRPPSRTAGPLRRVLVSFGGSGLLDGLRAVIEGLSQHDLEVRIVTPSPGEVSQLICPRPGLRVEPFAPSLREALEWADLAILGAGTTRYEAAFLGTPALLVILAENQVPGREAFEATGCARFLGWAGELTPAGVASAVRALGPEERARMSLAGQALVDGLGCDRVAKALLEL